MTSHAQKAKGAKSTAASAKKSKFSSFTGVIEELRKARWPTRQETLRLSVLVIIICAVMGAILGIIDYGFTRLFSDLFLGGK